ncbi:tripartite tricarboxylate transporter substrate binding protein [uncultured Xylophilus sp.]|uniref:tripartite tricarboxylate transporter substrate binding protein n=1 Tax=uncultured Xylophilus sp. TaxID=296832 RepID=UPI0025E61794|nr:tripartite tricarboxylate transporter substrate binding protein [uncultured Xylophilus sp.]
MKKNDVRRALLLAAALAPLAGAPAFAQDGDAKARVARLKPKDFPTQPIEVNVVYPAGGGMDLNARLTAKAFEKITGAQAIVNNRTGGAGLVGHTWLANQAPNDGYTVAIIANLIFADSMLRGQGRWSYDKLEPIAFLNSEGNSLVVSADGPYKDKSFKDMVELAKAKPGTVRISILPGTIFEYMVEQVETVTGAKFLKVPFQGGAPSITALLGNNVDIAIAYYGEIRSFLDAKKLVPVAVSSAERSPFLPQAPTLNEVLGRNDVVWGATRWVAVPKGVPAERKAYLAAAFGAAARDPELQEEFRKLGAVGNTGLDTPEKISEHLAGLVRLERDFYAKSGRLK